VQVLEWKTSLSSKGEPGLLGPGKNYRSMVF
jgi:hypothetical protein